MSGEPLMSIGVKLEWQKSMGIMYLFTQPLTSGSETCKRRWGEGRRGRGPGRHSSGYPNKSPSPTGADSRLVISTLTFKFRKPD